MDRPILFSALMVRALLDGRKTQTRRVLNPQPYDFAHPGDGHRCWNASGVVGGRICISDRGLLDLHHKPRSGDRLYAREAWRCGMVHDTRAPREMKPGSFIAYEADGPHICASVHGRFRQGMHMPRWASRLTLTVTDVRVQRLQEISKEDAGAEGVDCSGPIAVNCYRVLWDSLNAGRGYGWDANPWIVAVTFTVERRNIDEAA